MTYQPKKQTCPLCKGNKTVIARKSVFVFGAQEKPSQETLDLADAMAKDDSCPHCNGVGEVNAPPYTEGKNALMPKEKMRELAKAGTLIRCLGDAVFVQAVANEAARIALPPEVVETYVAYWADPGRDVTLGEYIMQIAETAEQLAMRIYGNLGNPIFAGPRHCGELP